MEKDKENKKFLEKLEAWFPLLFFAFGVAGFVYLNVPKEHNLTIITVIGILLGFLAIFYPLIIKREVTEKRSLLIKEKFNQLSQKLKEKLDESEKHIKGEKYGFVEENIEDMSNSLSNFSDINLRADIDNHLFQSVVYLIISLLLLTADLILPILAIKGFYVIKLLGVLSFIGGAYKSLIVIYSWRAILSQK